MRVLVTKLQKVERVAFAPEGTHLFASGLHADSLGYGEPDLGIDVFDLAGDLEPVAHLLESRVVRWFVPLTGGHIAVAQSTSSDDSDYDVGIGVFDWRTDRGTRFTTRDWEVWYPCAVGPNETRLVAGLVGSHFGTTGRRHSAVERAICAWKFPGGSKRPRIDWKTDLGRERQPLFTAFTPDGRSIWTAEHVTSRTVPYTRIEFVPRDADTGNPLREPIPYPNQHIAGLALSDTFAVAHDGPTLFVYDLANLDRKPKKVTNPAKRKHFAGLAIHPSGKWLAAAGLDGAVTLWNTQTWTVLRNWVWDEGQARSVCFSADGTLAAAGTNTGKIVVWDLDL